MLLHGPPGVGKTSTVGKSLMYPMILFKTVINEGIIECLAAYAKKPLLPISAGGSTLDVRDS